MFMRQRLVGLAAFVLVGLVAGACSAGDSGASDITEAEVLAAQQGWCDALLAISAEYAAGGRPAATVLAGEIIDAAYGYQLGPVLFKPTLASGEQTVRTTRAGALAYFVGGDADFADDSGFALKGWTECRIDNAALIVEGDLGLTMGFVHFVNADGQTTVDKSWAFRKTADDSIRIVLHHSSLPYAG